MRAKRRDGKTRGKGATSKELIEKSRARAFMKRWTLVNALEKKALRDTPADDKLSQLAVLMNSVGRLDWKMQVEGEVREIRDRWNRLRRLYHA